MANNDELFASLCGGFLEGHETPEIMGHVNDDGTQTVTWAKRDGTSSGTITVPYELEDS